MRLPKDFPNKINETNVIYATRPKCSSSIHDIETKVTVSISYYALAQHDKNPKICLFSLNDHFKVLDKKFFSTVEKAMSSMEPDGLTPEDWKFIKL
jgi:hypothetical protein